MKVSNRQLAQTILGELKAGKPAAEVTTRLAAYLVSERRSKDADAIIRELDGLLQKQDGQVELNVTTAYGLSGELRSSIEQLFGNDAKKVIINEQQDRSVLGGVLVESGEQRLDLTVRRRLQRLKGVNN